MFFDIYCANDEIISLGTKESIETNVSIKMCFHPDKSNVPVFLVSSSATNHSEHLFGVCKVFYNSCVSYRIIASALKLSKEKCSEKSIFLVKKKDFGLFFLRPQSRPDLIEQLSRVPKDF